MNDRENFWRECAKWLQKLREIWLSDQDEVMPALWRWLVSFSGCFVFLALISTLSLYSPSAAPFISGFWTGFFLVFVCLCGISAYLALLLAWLPSKAGPVRRFLAALLLPAVTLLLIATVTQQFAMVINVPS